MSQTTRLGERADVQEADPGRRSPSCHVRRVPGRRWAAARRAPPGLARQVLAWLASTKLAVVLLVGIALVLAATTIVEAQRGREYAQWHVYKSPCSWPCWACWH